MNTIRKYKIKTIFGETIDVTFIHTRAIISSTDPRVDQVCTCILRRQDSVATVSATTIKNPNDTHDTDIAERQAFKKCIDRLYYAESIPFFGRLSLKHKTISSFYRHQLYKAKHKTVDEINQALVLAEGS